MKSRPYPNQLEDAALNIFRLTRTETDSDSVSECLIVVNKRGGAASVAQARDHLVP